MKRAKAERPRARKFTISVSRAVFLRIKAAAEERGIPMRALVDEACGAGCPDCIADKAGV